MAPGTTPHHDLQPDVARQLDKPPQIPLSAPIPLPGNLLVMNPKYVGGYDADPARLHLQQLLPPLRRRIAGIMKLTHHRQPPSAIPKERLRIKRDPIAGG